MSEARTTSDDLGALVAALDSAAWDARDEEEAGFAPDPPYLDRFSIARAVDAWRLADETTDIATAADAVYEAVHALGGDSEAQARVVELLDAHPDQPTR